MPKTNVQVKQITAAKPFDPSVISAVWEKAENEFGFFFFKRDRFGDIIAKHHYGEQSQYGWQIECVEPDAKESQFDIDNLRPVHWKNASHEEDPGKAPSMQ